MPTRLPWIARGAKLASPEAKHRLRGHLGRVGTWMKSRKELYYDSPPPVSESESSPEESEAGEVSVSEEEYSISVDNALNSDDVWQGLDEPRPELPPLTSSTGTEPSPQESEAEEDLDSAEESAVRIVKRVSFKDNIMESDSLPPTLRLASSPQPPKPQTPSPPPKTSNLTEEISATKVRTNAPSQVLTTTSSQLRQNNPEEGLSTMASNDPTPSLGSFQGNEATHIAVDTMTRGIYSSLLDFCGGRDSQEYVADRTYRVIHTLRVGHNEAATPLPKGSQSLKRPTPADFESPGASRRLQAQPYRSHSSQYGVQDTGPIQSQAQPYQSYSSQYSIPDTMPAGWPGSQARPPAFGQFDERDTGYTRLHSPAEFKSKNSFMQAQMGVDYSTIVEPRQNFPDQRPASVSKSGHGVRDRFGTSSRKRGVQASPYNTSRHDSRTSNTDNNGQENTTSISYDQRQPDRDQQRSYGDHQMLPPALPQTRSLHTKTNRTRSELASSFGAPTTPSRRRSQASTREGRDHGPTIQSRERYRGRDRSTTPRRSRASTQET